MTSRLVGGIGAAALLSLTVVAWGCGGGGYSSPTVPTNGGGGGAPASSTISIVGDRGSQSFSPNPSNVDQGSTVAFRNTDGVTHHIVANDGSFDTGNIAAGAASPAVTVTTNGARYHCTIHPGMVGSINASSGTPPPCSGLYC